MIQLRNINMLYTVIHFLSYQKIVIINVIVAQPCNMLNRQKAASIEMWITMFVSSGPGFLDSC